MSHRVFVYGSLLSGFWNHRLIEDGGGKLVGRGSTEKGFALIDLGAFPGAVRGEGRVVGEVWEVNDATFQRLDQLESNGSFYARERVTINFERGHRLACAFAWIYLLLRPGVGARSRLIPGGDWRAYVAAKGKTEAFDEC
jgi:gamma-glutamylcyclotransferase (GGCT)/AIG2-like uncharacterized protein YtfP